jgi:hypothetical protein
LLITYLNDGDIPESPSEPFLEELLELQKAAGQPVKAIPLPMEVRGSGGNAMGQIGPVPTPAVNPNVTAILSSLLGGGQAAYPPSAPVPSAPVAQDLAALLQSLTSSAQPQPQQPAPQPVVQNIPPNIDLSAILSQLQQPAQPLPTTQRWTSPPPSSSWDRREERTRESDGKWKAQIKREPGSRIKATRADDIRESVRNSSADQNVYRALCQFFVLPPPSSVSRPCTETYFRKRIIADLEIRVLLCILGICRCMINESKERIEIRSIFNLIPREIGVKFAYCMFCMVFWECTQAHGGMVAGVTIFFKVRYIWFIDGGMIMTRLCLHVMVFGDCGSSK